MARGYSPRRDRLALLRDMLSLLDRPTGNWEMVRLANLNFRMWVRYRDWMRAKGLIKPVEGNKWMRTERGGELLRRIEAVMELLEEG